jgi:hypothetical protein
MECKVLISIYLESEHKSFGSTTLILALTILRAIVRKMCFLLEPLLPEEEGVAS